MFISVAFIQVLKASTPVAVLLCSFVFGLEKPSVRLSVYIVAITTGIGIACYAEVSRAPPP